jgi:hypothetical protein
MHHLGFKSLRKRSIDPGEPPTGLKPGLIPNGLRGPETAGLRGLNFLGSTQLFKLRAWGR